MANQETIVADSRIESYVAQAKEAGMPRDQVERLIAGGYFAFPKILPFHVACREADEARGPDQILLGGTRYFGKSHAVMAQVGLDDCQRVPGLKWLFLRKIQKSASESFEDLVYRVFRFVNHRFTEGQVQFPNGSRIVIGGFNNESDIDKYLGIEYDGLVIEEASQLSETKKQKIDGSIRTSIPGWRARKLHTTNPDGVGLAWIKRQFIQPWRENRQVWTRFYNCHWRDNPLAKEEYVRYLQNLTGPLARAWRDGDWDAFEGQAFPQWDYSRHVVQPFEIPDEWYRWRAIDWGYSAPWCCLWLAQRPGLKRVYVYRMEYATNLTDTQQAERILQMTLPAEKIPMTYADPSMWGKKTVENTVTSSADTYQRAGITLTKADNDRLGGKRKVDELLADGVDGLPMLQIFSTCLPLIDQMSSLVYDKIKTEDVDTDMEDHAYDALRYGLTTIRPATQPTVPERPNPFARMQFSRR